MITISFRARTSGNGKRFYLDDNTHLDVSWYESDWVVDVHIGHWRQGRPIALSSLSKTFFRLEKILPKNLCEKYYTSRVNRLSMKVAGVKII